MPALSEQREDDPKRTPPNMFVSAGEHVKYRRFVRNELHLIPLSRIAFLWV
jgi:hypothetical protein